MENVKYLSAGERGLVIEFGDVINPEINHIVNLVANAVTNNLIDGVLETVPTYRSLFLYFNPLLISKEQLIEYLNQILKTIDNHKQNSRVAKVVDIPVCYSGEFAPDIAFVAEYNNLSVDEVISIHTSTAYLIYALGFTPGFPYLGGMSERIAVPRLDQPRIKIPAGSVGIAGGQTGFYPIESPGGWRLIGRTPVRAFNFESSKPFLFAAGDYLHFYAISESEYYDIQKRIEQEEFFPKISMMDIVGGTSD